MTSAVGSGGSCPVKRQQDRNQAYAALSRFTREILAHHLLPFAHIDNGEVSLCGVFKNQNNYRNKNETQTR